MRIILALLLALPVAANEPVEPNSIEGLLAAETPREQALGAYKAADDERKDTIPALRKMLAAEAAKEDGGSAILQRTILDSLIRLEAKLPWKELEPYFRRTRTHVMILVLLHAQDHRDLLLDLFDSEKRQLRYLEWVATANALVAQPTPRFAQRLLKDIEITVHLDITSPDQGPRAGGFASSGSGRGSGRITVQQGWPPYAVYYLEKNAGTREVLVAPGRTPIYYRRHVVESGTGGTGGSTPKDRRNSDRFGYLAELLGKKRSAIPIDDTHRVGVVFTDDATYKLDAAAARHEAVERFRKLCDQFVALGLLDANVANRIKPRTKYRAFDLRERGSPALPALD
ncbi:MAG: hypothetical protein V3T86_03235 [Planctomycetota bacterium]